MVGMGLLLGGSGMITTMPLCEVESFTRFGAQDNWVQDGSGMGNGSIFVTIRAVGRARIVESELIQEEPYIKARVVEVLDEVITLDVENGIKEKSSGSGSDESSSDTRNKRLSGVSSPQQVGSSVASTIENLMVNLSSMEHKLSQVKAKTKEVADESDQTKIYDDNKNSDDSGNEVMNTRLEAARLEELFMKDSNEGLDLPDAANDDEVEEENEEEDDDIDEDVSDRVKQFQEAFESARETDHQGYILQPTRAADNITDEKFALRSPKDLTAISWAAFCTGSNDGSKESIQRQAMQIQALDMTNVIKRMQLASAMLREEQKNLKAKLALAGIQDIFRGGDGGTIDEE